MRFLCRKIHARVRDKIISIQYFLNPVSTGLAGHPLDLNGYFFILLHQNLRLQLFQLIVEY